MAYSGSRRGIRWRRLGLFRYGPDASAYGAPDYPVGTRRAEPYPQVNLVGAFSHYDQLYSSHAIAKAASPSTLRRAPQELALTYSFDGQARSLDDYLERNPATGLLIARGEEVLFEHYRYARTDRDRLVSHSMAKTITAMLLGIAIEDGKIRSLDEAAAAYVPDIAGTEYGKTPIRALLHMASGVAFHEVYDGKDDIAKFARALFVSGSSGPAKAVAMFDNREAPPDTRFHYASIETEVLGLVLAGAVQMTPAAYLETRIWQKMGAEADASWVVDATGHEGTYCCFSAVLRDWARLGLVLAHDGAWNGQQIIPRQWLLDATTIAPGEGFRRPGIATPYYGYGYQVWIFPGPAPSVRFARHSWAEDLCRPCGAARACSHFGAGQSNSSPPGRTHRAMECAGQKTGTVAENVRAKRTDRPLI